MARARAAATAGDNAANKQALARSPARDRLLKLSLAWDGTEQARGTVICLRRIRFWRRPSQLLRNAPSDAAPICACFCTAAVSMTLLLRMPL